MTPQEYAREIGLSDYTIYKFLRQSGLLDPEVRYVHRHLRATMSAEAEAALRALPRDALAQLEGLSWNTAPDLVTTAQAAQLAHTTTDTIRQWAARGKLERAGRQGRSTTYRRDDVRRAYVEASNPDSRTSRYRTSIYVETRGIPRDALLTVAEAALITERPEATIRSWLARGILPRAGRTGRQTLIRAYDIAGATSRTTNPYDIEASAYDDAEALPPPSQRQ